MSENPILFTDPEGLSRGGAYYELTGVYFLGVSGSFKEVYDRCQHKFCATTTITLLIGEGGYGGGGGGGFQGRASNQPIDPGEGINVSFGAAGAVGVGSSFNAAPSVRGISGSATVQAGFGEFSGLHINKTFTACDSDEGKAAAESTEMAAEWVNGWYD